VVEKRPKVFYPTDAALLQRYLNVVLASAALAAYPFYGVIALWGVGGLATLAFGRQRRGRRNLIDVFCDWVDARTAKRWNAFAAEPGRKRIAVSPRPPKLRYAFLGLLPALATMYFMGVEGANGPLWLRMLAAVLSMAILILTTVGFKRRTELVIGADGVHVEGQAFVRAQSVERCVTTMDNLGVELRGQPPLPLTISVASPETAQRLQRLLVLALDRACATKPPETRPVQALGFREAAAQVPWAEQLQQAASTEERQGILLRVEPDEFPKLRVLLEETADPDMAEAIRAHVESQQKVG